MQHPFRHPLAAHAAWTVLGYRRNGAPIYAIAGGNGEGEGGSGTPAPAGDPTPPAPTPTPPAPAAPPSPAQGDDGTDWKAEARKWEQRAKENTAAAKELEKLRQAQMTDAEKAVEAARTEGRTAAEAEARSTALQLAVYRSAAAAGADPDALLDSRAVLDALAEIDPKDSAAVAKAITAAVKANPRLATAPTAPSSGPALPGGPGGQRQRPTSLGAAISGHYGQQ